MKRLKVRGHIIWAGVLGGDEQLDILIQDLLKSIEKGQSIHVLIFKEGETHNENPMYERQQIRVMNSS